MRENYGPDWESDLNSNNDFSSDVDGFDLDINNTVIEFARLWGQYEGGGNTTDLITVYETRELSNVLHDWAKEYLNSSDRKDLEVFFKFKMDTLFKKDNLVEREAGGQNISTSVGPFHKRGR